MKRRIFWKFFAGFFAMSLFLALTFYFLTVGQVRSFYVKTYEEHLQKLGTILNAELIAVWPEMDANAMDRFIKVKGEQAQTRLTVIDRQGKVLADSQKDPLLMQNHSDRPEVAAALSGQRRSEIHFSFTLRENMLYFAMPLQVDGKTVAALRLSLFFKDIEHEFAPWRWKITAALLVLLGLSMLFSYILSRNLARPIRDLAQAARHVASGDLDSHVQSQRRDEIGQLTTDFNAMVDSQKDMVQKLQHSQQELETILASISDGLLVIDSQERITRAGPRFCRLIGDPNPLGKPYWEVLRISTFDELIKKSSGGQTVHTEIEINQRVFLVSLSPLPANGGTVVTFHDLSETRHLEKQKKDFVANVSHELRTPLTAIKGYAETLNEESSGDVRKYLDVILRHTDRLIDLTADLLTLSELEEKNLQPLREPIDWLEMLTRIRGLFEKRLREKQLSLDIGLPEDPEVFSFRGDPFRLEQLFINLLDNAVKYTEKGGIAIRFSTAANRLLIEIRDSGMGIASEHLPRLFERFYVADKARSRQTGGTGLGLAIAKHIVELHGGKIEVQSTPGMGTVFTIVFPMLPQ
jgi:two-component system phosphate regulon sensor histidine kinase PhoR